MADEGEVIDWLFEGTRWWLGERGGFDWIRGAHILLPTDQYFPVTPGAAGHALADELFDFARHHAGLNEWPLELVFDDEPDPTDLMRGMPHAMTGATKGGIEGDPLVEDGAPLPIPYGASHLANPNALVATIGRGFSHYLLEDAKTLLPQQGEDQRELYVDLGAILLGFGVFTANASFNFQQATEGLMASWGYSRTGALSQREQGLALGFVVTLLEAPWRKVAKHLQPNSKADMKRGMKLLKKRAPALNALRGMVAPSDGPYR